MSGVADASGTSPVNRTRNGPDKGRVLGGWVGLGLGLSWSPPDPRPALPSQHDSIGGGGPGRPVPRSCWTPDRPQTSRGGARRREAPPGPCVCMCVCGRARGGAWRPRRSLRRVSVAPGQWVGVWLAAAGPQSGPGMGGGVPLSPPPPPPSGGILALRAHCPLLLDYVPP